MALLSITPKLYPLIKYVQVLHLKSTDATGVEIDYVDVAHPPTAFFATSNAWDATAAHANLNCTVSHLGSGWWLFTIPSANLTYAVLNGAFTMPGTPPVLIVIVPGSARDHAIGEFAPYRQSTGSAPILYPDCKFDLAIEFTTTDSNGNVVDYTSAMGTPSCFFAQARDHDTLTADPLLTCTLTYISGRLWSASIPSANISYTLLNSKFALPSAPMYFLQIVPSSSRDFSLASWKAYREALAA